MAIMDETRSPHWRRWLPVALIALVTLLIGYGLGALTVRPSHPGDDSAEAGFARDMSSHHAQAVEMGMIAYQRGSDQEVKVLAGDIATTQQAQIGIMKTWLDEWGLLPTGEQPKMAWMPADMRGTTAGGLMPGMASQEEMDKLRNAPAGPEVDKLFLQYMLRHHLGGIHMIDAVLTETDDPEVHDLAAQMRNNQSGEVATLTQIMKRLSVTPLATD
jgi:uncharacterized protein (DUF305 family)